MSKIILLNGCGSSGKTSIARSIQHLSEDLWITFGVDSLIDMMPRAKQDEYLKFIPRMNQYGPEMHVEVKPKGADLFCVMPDFANLLANKGHNLIIDEVLFEDSKLQHYAEKLRDHTTYFIGVFCDLAAMQEREILRQNRHIGLSSNQFDRVHTGIRSNYDLKVDTTRASSFEVAKQILAYVSSKNPIALKKIWTSHPGI
ncbi:MAG: hypothetical protein V4485_03955 [Pseudomonadota bacterium]